MLESKKRVVQETRRNEKFEACRESVFGPRKEEIISSGNDKDPYMRRGRREERRRMQYEAATRGSQYEQGAHQNIGERAHCSGMLDVVIEHGLGIKAPTP